jgi:DNA mismatch repair protein MSH5
MAIEMKQRRAVGCAYYVAIEEALYLQEDIPVAGLELVETLLVHVQPTTILIPSRGPDELAEYLEANAQDLDGHTRGGPYSQLQVSFSVLMIIGLVSGAYILRTISSSEFRYETAREQLLNLKPDHLHSQTVQFHTVVEDEAVDDLDGDATGGQKQSRLMRLSTLINLDSTVSVGFRSMIYELC